MADQTVVDPDLEDGQVARYFRVICADNIYIVRVAGDPVEVDHDVPRDGKPCPFCALLHEFEEIDYLAYAKVGHQQDLNVDEHKREQAAHEIDLGPRS